MTGICWGYGKASTVLKTVVTFFLQNVQEWGNRRAADYYEYHLPNGFKRPHGDSSLEQFIRNKYEKKLYINKGGPPPQREAINSPEKVHGL